MVRPKLKGNASRAVVDTKAKAAGGKRKRTGLHGGAVRPPSYRVDRQVDGLYSLVAPSGKVVAAGLTEQESERLFREIIYDKKDV
jgi:hypothetical protein